ncbi:MAG: hypothetical protein ACR2JY_19130 [Chloroflexota bacterium]
MLRLRVRPSGRSAWPEPRPPCTPAGPRSRADQTLIDRRLQPARQTLGKQVTDVTWAAGGAMTLDEAIHYALDGEPT